MIRFLFLTLGTLFCLSGAAMAESGEGVFFQAGVDAFNARRYDEAEKILKKFEYSRPEARIMMDAIRKERQKEKGPSYDVFLERLNKGDTNQLDNIGLLPRFSGEISGLSGNMYLQTLLGNAQKGDIPSIYKAALLYQEGIGLPRNFSAAADLFEKAAEKNHRNALNAAGVYSRFGIGRKKADSKKARDYLFRAVLLNNPDAFYNLGRLYLDNNDPLQALFLAEFGINRVNSKASKQKLTRFLSLRKEAFKKLTPLQKAYANRFVPFSLSPVATPADLKGRIYPKKLPLPPQETIRETSFFFPLKRDPYDNKYKTLFPFVPEWVPFDSDQKDNPALNGKKLPFPSTDDENAISTLYYRAAYPAVFHLMLTKPENAIPVLVGDVFEIAVYSKLHETAQTKKGAHMYIGNTEYKIVLESPDGAIITDHKPVLTPLSIETRNEETWLSQAFEAKKPGTAIIKFVPTNGGFAHTLLIRASVGKAPR